MPIRIEWEIGGQGTFKQEQLENLKMKDIVIETNKKNIH